MAELNLPNIREGGNIRFRIGLEDGGVAVDWSGLEDIRVFLYADAQKQVSGEMCEVAVDEEDNTVLKCKYSGDDVQYRGINSVLVRAKYLGEIKVYDKPAINIVARTSEATGVVEIDDPVVPVQISVEDVSTSLLNNAIDAAINAAAEAEKAAHLVPLQVLEDCVEATGKALEAASKAPYIDETTGNWFVWDAEAGEYVDSGKTARGATGNGIASWSVVESAEDAGNNVVTVTFTDGTSESFNVKNGHTGNGIASIVQTVESPDDAGTNVITITMTNGTVVTFNVKNGSKGTPGVAQAAYKSVSSLPTASAQTMDMIYLTPSGTSGVYNMSYTEFDGSAYSWHDLGTTAIQLSDYATKAELNQLEHEVTDLRDDVGNKVLDGTERVNFTIESWTASKYVNYLTGNLDSVVGVKASSAIDVSQYQGKTLHYDRLATNQSSGYFGMCFYDGDGVRVSGEAPIVNHSATEMVADSVVIPTGAVTARFSCLNADTDSFSAYVEISTYVYSDGLGKRVQDLETDVNNKGQQISAIDGEISTIKKNGAFAQSADLKRVPFSFTIGKGIYKTGNESSVVGLFASSFIDVVPGETLSWTGGLPALADFFAIWGYDSNKANGQGLVAYGNTAYFANKQKLTIPSGIYYIKVSFVLDNFFAIERTDEKTFVPVSTGKNKYDDSELVSGNYISTNGREGNDSVKMGLTGLMDVKPNTTYHLSDAEGNAVGNSASLHQFLDKDRNVISTIAANTQDFTTPATARYFRASVLLSATEIQLEEGRARTVYEPYNKIGGYLRGVTAPQKFGTFRNTGTLANGDALTLPKLHIVKNILLSGSIEGTIDANGVEVGVGYVPDGATKDYDARWLLITDTTVQFYWNRNNGDLPINPLLNHGLTLTGLTHFAIEVTVTKDAYTATFRLANDLGDVYTVNIMNYVANGWGVGMPFVKNNCLTSVMASLSFAPRDITKRIWCFGDSYFSFLNNSRWPYYAKADGNIGWFSNNQGGLTPESAYGDLVNMLSLGNTPTYLLWCLGMNGDAVETQVDGQYVINTYQKTWIDAVLALCEKKQIIPVFGIVPTVPTCQKTGFDNYIKSLGVRYVDFAKAVGANSAGVWNPGLLSNDGVHPSETGGKVLYSQVLVDFPEISINE